MGKVEKNGTEVNGGDENVHFRSWWESWNCSLQNLVGSVEKCITEVGWGGGKVHCRDWWRNLVGFLGFNCL